MELTLERRRCTKDFTTSLLYNSENRKLFVIDVVEPPLAGMSQSKYKALDPGRYKLFLKPDPDGEEIVAVFQSVVQRPRFSLARMEEDKPLEEVTFKSENKVSKALMQCGKIKNNTLCVDRGTFSKFMISCIISKQHKQVVWVNVK